MPICSDFGDDGDGGIDRRSMGESLYNLVKAELPIYLTTVSSYVKEK